MTTATPLAAVLDILLHKDVPESSESVYFGPVLAITALEGPADDGVKRNATQLVAASGVHLELVEHDAVELLLEQLASSDRATRLFSMQALMHFALDVKTHDRLHRSGRNGCVASASPATHVRLTNPNKSCGFFTASLCRQRSVRALLSSTESPS